jgi:hypothetical protein
MAARQEAPGLGGTAVGRVGSQEQGTARPRVGEIGAVGEPGGM